MAVMALSLIVLCPRRGRARAATSARPLRYVRADGHPRAGPPGPWGEGSRTGGGAGMSDIGDGDRAEHRPRRPRGRRAGAVLASMVLALSPGHCDTPPALPGRRADEGSSPAAGETIEPSEVAAAESTPVDPSWLCRPGQVDPPVDSAEGGTMTPRSVRADGSVLEGSGPFHLAEGHRYRGFAPVG